MQCETPTPNPSIEGRAPAGRARPLSSNVGFRSTHPFSTSLSPDLSLEPSIHSGVVVSAQAQDPELPTTWMPACAGVTHP